MTDSRTLSARLRAKKQEWYRIMANHPAYQDKVLLDLMDEAASELEQWRASNVGASAQTNGE